MKSFKAFMVEKQQLEEAIIKKGAVAAYALQGRKHGNNSVKSYNRAKRTLKAAVNTNDTDKKTEAILHAIMDLLDGLIATRKQLGSVSAQVTASTIIS